MAERNRHHIFAGLDASGYPSGVFAQASSDEPAGWNLWCADALVDTIEHQAEPTTYAN
jgi:hypothetical protein